MKWVEMLVVSLRGVNFGIWSRLGCSGQNTFIYLAAKVSFRVALEEMLKKLYIFKRFIYSIHVIKV